MSNQEHVKALEEYLQSLHRRYGPTYPIDAKKGERTKLVQLRNKVNFQAAACDKRTSD